MNTPYNIGAFVLGPPSSPRMLVKHADLFLAYSRGEMAERGEMREAYLSHFIYSDEMQRHYVENHNSVAGYAGPCWCRYLIVDIDRDDLSAALTDARRLVAAIRERYGIDDLPVWFSGSKGFHVAVELAHQPPPAVGFHRAAKAFAMMIAETTQIQIDSSVYDLVHIIRLPNTQHPKTGLYKRLIAVDDLMRISVDGIRQHAARPGADDMPEWAGDIDRLAGDWRNAEEVVRRDADRQVMIRSAAATQPDRRAPKWFLDFLRFGVEVGERHKTLFRCAAWLVEQGAPPSLCYALLMEPGCDVGLSPKDVERQIRCGIEHAMKQRVDQIPNLTDIEQYDAAERWYIMHEGDPLPPDATSFDFGFNVTTSNKENGEWTIRL
jgi:hypothetical protein